jgi:3-methyladenine DNA glycosylase Mpg
VRILRGSGRRPRIAVTPRIGVTQAADWPLRFLIAESPWVSR